MRCTIKVLLFCDRFPKEWDETSSHKIRSSTDMQYAFAYYYYLMGVTEPVTTEQVFDTMDTDHSGLVTVFFFLFNQFKQTSLINSRTVRPYTWII